MWVFLLIGTGMAWGITVWRTNQLQADLQPATVQGNMHARLPAGWKTQLRGTGEMRILTCSETGGPSRTLTITTLKLERLISPVELLVQLDLMPMDLLDAPERQVKQIHGLNIQNGNGILLPSARRQSSTSISAMPPETAACVVFDDGRVALVELVSKHPNKTADTALVMQISESLKLEPAATTEQTEDSGGSI